MKIVLSILWFCVLCRHNRRNTVNASKFQKNRINTLTTDLISKIHGSGRHERVLDIISCYFKNINGEKDHLRSKKAFCLQAIHEFARKKDIARTIEMVDLYYSIFVDAIVPHSKDLLPSSPLDKNDKNDEIIHYSIICSLLYVLKHTKMKSFVSSFRSIGNYYYSNYNCYYYYYYYYYYDYNY